MGRLRALVLAAVSIVAVVVLFLVLRPNDSDKTAETQTNSTVRQTTSTVASTTTNSKPPTPRQTVVAITVRGGRVNGGIRRVTVAQGRVVALVVTSDVADEVHLHGYDRSRNVAPGGPARLVFRATTPGRFDVELEDRQLQIAEITVEP